MKNLKFINSENNSKALFIANFIYYKEGDSVNDEKLKRGPNALWSKHNIKNILSINVTEKEAITGANTLEKPDEILIQTIPNVEAFNAYINDSDYKDWINIQEETIRKMTFVVGTKIDYREMASDAPFDERVYALGMLYYKPEGKNKLKEFTDKAVPLFMKHSFYADKFLDILDKGAFIGDADDFVLPDELRVFWSDSSQDLENYNNDPDYHAIKDIREEGVADYPTFLGRYGVNYTT